MRSKTLNTLSNRKRLDYNQSVCCFVTKIVGHVTNQSKHRQRAALTNGTVESGRINNSQTEICCVHEGVKTLTFTYSNDTNLQCVLSLRHKCIF